VLKEKRDIDQVISLADPGKNLVTALAILGIAIDRKIASVVSGLRNPYGIIAAAKAAGTSSEAPLVAGDVVRELNGRPMTTLDKLREALKALPSGSPAVLQIQREGRLQFLAFTVN
jgi:serine protease Do